MADITNPIIVKFSNERIRPLAERVRNLKANIDDAAALWTTEVLPLLAGNVDGDILDDGRALEGITALTKKDIVDLVAVIGSIKVTLDVAGVMDTVRRPTVRPLKTGE